MQVISAGLKMFAIINMSNNEKEEETEEVRVNQTSP